MSPTHIGFADLRGVLTLALPRRSSCGLIAGKCYKSCGNERSKQTAMQLELLDQMLGNRNVWLLACFSVYLISIFAFAILYYRLYRKNTTLFLFSRDILNSQRGAFAVTANRSIDQLELEIEALRHLYNQLCEGADFHALRDHKTVGHLPSGHGYVISERKEVIYGTPGDAPETVTYYDLEIQGPEKTTIRTIGLGGQLYRWERGWDARVGGELRTRERTVDDYRRRLGTLQSDSPEIWSFWDFVYFSAISQTTVGYGDILPNSTTVRILIVVQILIGYAIIVVLLNMIFAE